MSFVFTPTVLNADTTYHWDQATNWVPTGPPSAHSSISFNVSVHPTYTSTVPVGYSAGGSTPPNTLNTITLNGGVTLNIAIGNLYADALAAGLPSPAGGIISTPANSGALVLLQNSTTTGTFTNTTNVASATIEFSQNLASGFNSTYNYIDLLIGNSVEAGATASVNNADIVIETNQLASSTVSCTNGNIEVLGSEAGTLISANGNVNIGAIDSGANILLSDTSAIFLPPPADVTGGSISPSTTGASFTIVVGSTGVYLCDISGFTMADDAVLFLNNGLSPPYTYTNTGGELVVSQGATTLYTLLNFGSDIPITESPTPFPAPNPFIWTNGLSYYSLGTVSAEPCFVDGTHISTPFGATKVEDLQVGDLVLTFNDGVEDCKKIKWIGVRTGGTLQIQEEWSPIRIMKDAFAEGKPCADLFVSPKHGLYVEREGVLVAAKLLENGRSIFQDHGRRVNAYYHIELEQHSIIRAEGLETESFLDVGFKHRFYGEKKPDPSAFTGWEKGVAHVIYDQLEAESIQRKLGERAKRVGFKVHTTRNLFK